MGLSSFFKNLFNKTQEPAIETENTDEQITENAFIEKAENFIEETLHKIKEASEPILEDAAEFTSHAKDIISEYTEKATDSINDIIDSVKEISSETEDTKPLIYDTVVDVSEKAITSTDND